MSETGSEVRSGMGARLRAGREKMGLTQLQAAEKLHVDAKVVESLEAERFDALGAPVFVRGHLKHYAELIGEHAPALLELYVGATKPTLPDLTRLPKAARRTSPSRLAVPALVVLIGFVLVGVVWWIAKSVGGPEGAKPKGGPQPVAIAPEITQEPAVAEGSSDVPRAVGGPSGTAGANPASATSGASSRALPAVKSAGAASATPGAGARAVPAASGSAPTASSSAPAATGTATPSSTAARGKPMEVTLRFSADSWVEVYDANGQKLFYDVGSASSSHTVSGTPPFRVTVANAPGVSLDVNGKSTAVPANAVKGDEAQFLINRAGRIVRAPPKADGG